MKNTLSVLSILLSLSSAALLAQTSQKPGTTAPAGGGVEQRLLDMERKWVAAGLKNDATILAEILAEGWSSVSAEEKVMTRAETLEDVKKTKYTRSELSDMKVRMINADTAVVTGVWTGLGTDGKAQKVDSSERWTDVFANQGGKWKCVASHNTTLKK
jgi:ketosteroid isomerase-like protein